MSSYRQRVFEILERDVAGSRLALFVNGILILLILGSVTSVILESNDGLSQAHAEFFWKFEIFRDFQTIFGRFLVIFGDFGMIFAVFCYFL